MSELELPVWTIAAGAVFLLVVGAAIAVAVHKKRTEDAARRKEQRPSHSPVSQRRTNHDDRVDVYAEVLDGFASVHHQRHAASGGGADHDLDAGDGGDGVDCGCFD